MSRPGTVSSPTATSAVGLFPASDLVNSLSHPTGKEFRFVVSEGTYTLKDDILLGLIPHHPNHVPAPTTNVLNPTPAPLTSGVRLSLAILAPRSRPSVFRHSRRSGSLNPSIPPSIQESQTGSSQSAQSISEQQRQPTPASPTTQGSGSFKFGTFRVRFGDSNSQSTSKSKDAKDLLKRSKPKQGVGKTSSTFLSRVTHDEALSKRINEHAPDGIYAFANINRAFLWLDLSSAKKHENLTKILFTRSQPICHDFNTHTKTPAHLDVAVGFASGDILWNEPVSQKYSRINKNGIVHNSPVLEIKWVPKSDNLFVAAHLDGTLVIYDKEREDAAFDGEDHSAQNAPRYTKAGKLVPRLIVQKSIHSSNQNANPVGRWRVCSRKIRGIEFSPDGRLLAIVSEDGTLRIIDYDKEELLDVMPSYYGGMTCVAWSSDGMFLITGSQDDLVSIWSLADRALVARCIGHHSWLTHVAFDPWHCDDRTYRFGSVGEDGRLLLWDFSVGLLNKPQAASVRQSISSYAPTNVHDRRESVQTVKAPSRSAEQDPFADPTKASTEERPTDLETLQDSGSNGLEHYLQDRPTSSQASTSNIHDGEGQSTQNTDDAEENEDEDDDDDDEDEDEVYHPVVPRSHVPMLPPILSKIVDPHPLAYLAFEEDCIITTCRRGHIRIWERPASDRQSHDANRFRFADPFHPASR